MKYPGFILDKKFKLVNRDEPEIDLNRFKEFLLSKNLDEYRNNKEKFFGK